MTLASRLRCKSTARISNYQDFLQKNCRKILYDAILLYRLHKFHSYSPFFAPPLWNEVSPFSIPFDGIWGCFILSSRYMTSKHAITRRQFSIYSLLICHFPRRFLKKHGSFLKKRRSFSKKRGRFSKFRWTFSEKRGSFFQPPPRKDFSQQIETQKSRK